MPLSILFIVSSELEPEEEGEVWGCGYPGIQYTILKPQRSRTKDLEKIGEMGITTTMKDTEVRNGMFNNPGA